MDQLPAAAPETGGDTRPTSNASQQRPVSVVVPLYNKEKHILRCVQSIEAQSFGDFEAVIVDDGSTDYSVSRISSLLRGDPRFRLVSQVNAGPGAARNHGAQLASGQYLAFLDGDDEWAPTYLEHSLKALQGCGEADVVASGYIDFPEGINREAFWRRRGLTEGIFRCSPETAATAFVYVLAYMTCGNTIVSRNLFRRFGGFYDRNRALYAEDSWLWAQVLLNASVLIRFEPLTFLHREASELSANLSTVRPIEPFLLDPSPIWQACPAGMEDLLRRFLAIRALKTACVLGYWGQWREALAIVRRYATMRDATSPYFTPALVCSSPIGPVLGKLWRTTHR